MKKLIHISAVASPHWVRFMPFFRRYFDAEFYFYEQLSGRQEWWKMDLGEHGHILPSLVRFRGKHLSLSVIKVLRKERPDILMLGGFSEPSNYIAYVWAKKNNVPVVVFTERSRDKKGRLRSYGIGWRFLHFLYRDVDIVMTTSPDIVHQFRDDFHFGKKVLAGRYPTDIGQYFKHPYRTSKEAYTLIFPNRMTEIYNPIGAVEIFSEVVKRHPRTRLKMNASGEMRQEVEAKIREFGVTSSVEFLDNIKSWDDLSDVYASCDIMYLPAKFSNGNYTISECAASGMGCVISDRILGHSMSDMKKAGTGFILPLDNKLFVDKICWYIEHPKVLEMEAKINRDNLKYLTHEETAKFYFDLFKDLIV